MKVKGGRYITNTKGSEMRTLQHNLNGCVTVVCPKCNKPPVITATTRDERSDISCECGYIRDGEIYFKENCFMSVDFTADKAYNKYVS